MKLESFLSPLKQVLRKCKEPTLEKKNLSMMLFIDCQFSLLMVGFDQIEFIFCWLSDQARSYLFVQMSGQDWSLNVYLKAVSLSVWSGWHSMPSPSDPPGWKLQSVLERHAACCQYTRPVRFSWKSTFHADNLEHTFIVNNSGLIITSVHTPQIKSWCTLTHSQHLILTSSFLTEWHFQFCKLWRQCALIRNCFRTGNGPDPNWVKRI